MYSLSTFGLFVVLLFAYTPVQGQTFDVSHVLFENGEEYTSRPNEGVHVTLIRMNERLNTYMIVENVTFRVPGADQNSTQASTKAVFGINDIYTMFGRVVILRTTRNSYYQMELRNEPELQLLFNLTTRTKLREQIYSYKISAIYELGKGRILADRDLSISGCADAVSPLPVRYIIHTGQLLGETAVWRPVFFWTAPGFNYRVYDNKSIILTLAKPAEKTLIYYLVKFVDPSKLVEWKANAGKYHSAIIPEANKEIFEYFRDVYDRDA